MYNDLNRIVKYWPVDFVIVEDRFIEGLQEL